MSEQPQEETQAAPESAPDDTQEHEPTPDVTAPGESPETITEEDEAAESEEVEGQQGDQGEQGPPEAQALSQKEVEAVWKKFEKSSTVWRERVKTIMGGDADVLIPCPMCDSLIPGYIMPAPDIPDRFPSVREFMGDAQQRQLNPDPDTSQCTVCGGEGMLDMLSKVDGQQALVCGYCGGKGWVGTRHQSATSGPMAVQPLPDANGHTESGPPAIDPPDVAELKRKGYTIIPPVAVS